ncbi:LLM class F420-dependent oxidoreductase [Streptomyces sp. NPDC006385]|uniref:LLM class F420-dependent oxidoreductase n=1 Tax=Streptomyces sp. NPDC006385 TaxID=3156761 RepID=UPI0033B8C65A
MMDAATADPGSSLRTAVGRYGIWSLGLRSENPALRGEITEAAAELEELGFGAVWLGNNSTTQHAAPLIEATSRLTVATGIHSIWQQEPDRTAAQYAATDACHPGRFLLGLGVSHSVATDRYHRPYSSMVAYLDALDSAGVPAERRVLAALGPKMLKLSRDRAAGSHPYLVTAEHTAQARALLGDAPLLAPELKVVLEDDPDRARTIARGYLALYLGLENYTNSLLRLGYTEDDFADGGSDRLIDALVAWGDEDRIRARIVAFREAGADHVALQIVDGQPPFDHLPRVAWRRLAALLTGS